MVEWKRIIDIITYLPGGALKRNDVKQEGLYPVMNGGIDYSGYYDDYNYDENVLTISHWGSSASHVHRHYGRFWANNACWVFIPKNRMECNLLYLYQVLKERERMMMQTMCFGGATPNLNRSLFENQIIPIPSLAEQSRIVGILDTFTASIENLKQQIAQRRKQYEHYRDQLFDLEEEKEVKKYKLGDVCDIGDGIHGTPQYDENGVYFFINGNNLCNGKIILKPDTKKVNEEMFLKYGIELDSKSILMSINGTIGNIAFYNNERIVLGKSAAYFKVKRMDSVHYKYLYYYLQTSKANDYFNNSLTGSTIKNLGLKALRNCEFSIPSFSEQSRIVVILDTFEASIANLEQQLAQRERQYEYFRNKLLTF